MTRRVQDAIERLRAVPENQQDRLAEFLLHELEEDERWANAARDHADKVERPIERIRADDANGLCEPLDPERL